MEITIHSAILHVLDTHSDQPILADLLLEPDEESLRYLTAHIQRAFCSEEARDCRFDEASSLLPILQTADEDFVAASRKLAERWFELMQRWPAIPCADGLFLLAEIDNVPCIAGLKLNYKAAWLHVSEQAGGVVNRLVRQPSALPGTSGKADEAFFAALDGSICRVIEKKYDIDGKKSAYLCRHLLQAVSGYSPKEKLEVVKAAAVEVNQQFYGSLGMDEPSVAATLIESFCEEKDAPIPTASEICEALYGEVPHAREAFTRILEEKDLAPTEPVAIVPAAVRSMENQKLKAFSGVEVKVPVEVYKDPSAIEFIKNQDGTTSLLIKNILV